MSHFTGQSLNKVTFTTTLHCLTGCAIGEVLGMLIGTALGWSNTATIALAVILAFFIGYSFTVVPLVRTGMALHAVIPLALAADTVSIAVMEIIDNLVMVIIPGAMDAHFTDLFFWLALTVSLALAGAAAFPVNRWLLSRHKGHALIHEALPHHH